MKNVKIYTVVSDEMSPPIAGEAFCTDMVRASDYAALEQQLAAVFAENAGLKKFGETLFLMHKGLNGSGTGIQGEHEAACQQVALDAVMDAFGEIETPATDAFLAEVRAQGVEMLLASLPPYYTARADIEEFAAQLRQGADHESNS